MCVFNYTFVYYHTVQLFNIKTQFFDVNLYAVVNMYMYVKFM